MNKKPPHLRAVPGSKSTLKDKPQLEPEPKVISLDDLPVLEEEIDYFHGMALEFRMAQSMTDMSVAGSELGKIQGLFEDALSQLERVGVLLDAVSEMGPNQKQRAQIERHRAKLAETQAIVNGTLTRIRDDIKSSMSMPAAHASPSGSLSSLELRSAGGKVQSPSMGGLDMQRAVIQPPTNAIAGGIKRNELSTTRISAESATDEFARLMRGRDFKSMEDMQAFLAKVSAFRNSKIVAERLDSGHDDDPELTRRMQNAIAPYVKDFPEIAKIVEASNASLTKAEQAQCIMYDAWGARGAERVRLAKEALKKDKKCVDAHVLLGQESAKTIEEAHDLFLKADELGEKAISGQTIGPDQLWADLKTRPLLRAKMELGSTLWLLGEREDALDYLREVLRLNPTDNQGARYRLVYFLISEKLFDEAKELTNQFAADGASTWKYAKALLDFNLYKNSLRAKQSMRDAIAFNDFAPRYFLGYEGFPEEMPAYVGFGTPGEAVECAVLGIEHWRTTDGAMEWMRTCADEINGFSKQQAFKLWKTSNESAKRYANDDKFSKAKGQFLYALKHAEKLGDELLISIVLKDLCEVLANHLSEIKKADEPYFVRSLELAEQTVGVDDPRYVGPLFDYGCFKFAMSLHNDAEKYLTDAMSLAEKLNDDEALPAIYWLLGEVYDAKGEFAKSRRFKALAQELYEDE
jgi:tetratricopeptide (TPR) repeat protein